MKNIVVIGAGGFAREVAWLIDEINKLNPTWNFLGYIESDPSTIGQYRGKYPIYGDDQYLDTIDTPLSVVIGIGNPRLLQKISQRLQSNALLEFPNLVHPSVLWDEQRVQLGVGNIICAGNVFTTDIVVGNFNIINISSTYGHDDILGDCNVINPGCNISGGVRLSGGNLIGTGSKILENLTIGQNATVGGGAVVTKDVPPDTVVVGVPAKPLNR